MAKRTFSSDRPLRWPRRCRRAERSVLTLRAPALRLRRLSGHLPANRVAPAELTHDSGGLPTGSAVVPFEAPDHRLLDLGGPAYDLKIFFLVMDQERGLAAQDPDAKLPRISGTRERLQRWCLAAEKVCGRLEPWLISSLDRRQAKSWEKTSTSDGSATRFGFGKGDGSWLFRVGVRAPAEVPDRRQRQDRQVGHDLPGHTHREHRRDA